MIDWGRTPKGSIAKIYLPAVSADEILDMSSRMYVSNRLTKIDAITRCSAAPTALRAYPHSGARRREASRASSRSTCRRK